MGGVTKKGVEMIAESPRETCVHHWYIDEALDITSKGVCRRCGEVRTFSNAAPQVAYPHRLSDSTLGDQGALLARAV
jgi:hypothetical protein